LPLAKDALKVRFCNKNICCYHF